MDRLNFLHVAKRSTSEPWSTPPSGDFEDASDLEKTHLFDDDYSSTSSSRATSYSYEPMLQYAKSPHLALRKAGTYTSRLPLRRFNRYFTIIIASAIIVFVLTLIGLSRSSARAVEETHRPPPPPPYEKFPFLKRYHGGIRTLVTRANNTPEYPGDEKDLLEALNNATASDKSQQNQKREITKRDFPRSEIFNPYGDQASNIKECFLDVEAKIRVPRLKAYNGIPQGFPDNVMGSYDLLGLKGDVCFDRFGRLGPYGLGYSRKFGGNGACMEGDTEGAEQVWNDDPQVDYREVRWAEVQRRCAELNNHRFAGKPPTFEHIPGPEPSSKGTKELRDLEELVEDTWDATPEKEVQSAAVPRLPRTVVLLRTWNDFKYDPEDVLYLRALIAELSIGSGTEYTIHFLVHVLNNDIPIWSDEEIYQKTLNDSLPEEFRGMATLWSDKQLQLLYQGLEDTHYNNIHVHGAYRSTYMPVQWFSHEHPEYDFVWHWEMDARYTGHFYHLFDRIGKWAKAQPRKGLWERNARFYVPSEHGSWDDFSQMVRVHTQHGTNSKSNLWSKVGNLANDLKNSVKSVEKPIWGPEPPELDELDTSNDPKPPATHEQDKYEWGVGEDADFITFNPLFDPDETGWILDKDVTGYNLTNGYPPRRTAIITASRLSRRLLKIMHLETSRYLHTMFSEMWPGSCALHHGYKAVYAPHPVFIDRRWPTDYLAAIFNGGRNGASGGSRMSVFNDDRQVNFLGTTWYYNAGFAPRLWKRWLGYKVDNDGGEQWELAKEGRMCLPAMLLHPVKQTSLIYEHRA